jgi:hypothetical protein
MSESTPAKSKPVMKAAATAIGMALLLNDKRKKVTAQWSTNSEKLKDELVEAGRPKDQKIKEASSKVIQKTKDSINEQVDSTKASIQNTREQIEDATEQGRDKLLQLSGVATHKEVKDNAKTAHIDALSDQLASVSENTEHKLDHQAEVLEAKVDKIDLQPLAKTEEMKDIVHQAVSPLATAKDLEPLATSSQLEPLAKTSDLTALDLIPTLTEKVDVLAEKSDLEDLAKEKSVKSVNSKLKSINEKVEAQHSRLEILLAQLATKQDITQLSGQIVSKSDIDEATQLLASKEDMESIVKQLIKHIHHLERQVTALSEQAAKAEQLNSAALKPSASQSTANDEIAAISSTKEETAAVAQSH